MKTIKIEETKTVKAHINGYIVELMITKIMKNGKICAQNTYSHRNYRFTFSELKYAIEAAESCIMYPNVDNEKVNVVL